MDVYTVKQPPLLLWLEFAAATRVISLLSSDWEQKALVPT